MRKKFVSIVLTAAMAVSLLAMPVSAADVQQMAEEATKEMNAPDDTEENIDSISEEIESIDEISEGSDADDATDVEANTKEEDASREVLEGEGAENSEESEMTNMLSGGSDTNDVTEAEGEIEEDVSDEDTLEEDYGIETLASSSVKYGFSQSWGASTDTYKYQRSAGSRNSDGTITFSINFDCTSDESWIDENITFKVEDVTPAAAKKMFQSIGITNSSVSNLQVNSDKTKTKYNYYVTEPITTTAADSWTSERVGGSKQITFTTGGAVVVAKVTAIKSGKTVDTIYLCVDGSDNYAQELYKQASQYIESQIWTSGMSNLEKLNALANYISSVAHYPNGSTTDKASNPTLWSNWAFDGVDLIYNILEIGTWLSWTMVLQGGFHDCYAAQMLYVAATEDLGLKEISYETTTGEGVYLGGGSYSSNPAPGYSHLSLVYQDANGNRTFVDAQGLGYSGSSVSADCNSHGCLSKIISFNFKFTYTASSSSSTSSSSASSSSNTSTGTVKKASDGNWYYYVNGVKDTSYTGFATNSNGKWYVEKGKVTKKTNGVFKDKTGAIGTAGNWYYVLNSKVQTGFTGLANYKNSSGWWYITKGKVDRSYTGLAKNKNGWFYVKSGKVDRSYTGFASNSNGKWYVSGGKVTKTKNGVLKDSKGAIGSKNAWYYVVGSKVQTSYTGLANYSNSSGWWYITKGKVDRSYNGLAKNKNGWFYLKNGKVDRSYTGLATNSKGTWYVKNGKVQKSYTGSVTINGKKYSVTKGKVNV